MKTAILLIGHGSRVAGANQPLYEIATLVQEMTGCEIVEVCCRQAQADWLQAGIDRCVARGAERLLLHPYFLYAGAHVVDELPAQMALAAKRHPQLAMLLSEPLGVDRKLAEVVCARLAAALGEEGWELPLLAGPARPEGPHRP
ncbi:MAG: CbiX/SirB N-terminal domain-containing protein [Desulfuromonadales bacterium]|nr:CbiX/SirB N-terminal domain-containing protein [Desulfuromonadales bacterium]